MIISLLAYVGFAVVCCVGMFFLARVLDRLWELVFGGRS